MYFSDAMYRRSLQFTIYGATEIFVNCKFVKIKENFSRKTVKWAKKFLKVHFFALCDAYLWYLACPMHSISIIYTSVITIVEYLGMYRRNSPYLHYPMSRFKGLWLPFLPHLQSVACVTNLIFTICIVEFLGVWC